MPAQKLTEFQRRLLEHAATNDGLHGRRRPAHLLGTNTPNLSRSLRLLQSRGLMGTEYPYEITDAGRGEIA